ncbi:MAG: PfkB family carbohydrate kinase [Chloroflexota bacterium]|nr:PfkB family carbohydrate kinase [Chloroflexota bacterium]
MPGGVLVVGSVNVDFVCAVSHLPAPGETVTGGTFARHPGGKGGNQAVAAARLGAAVAFVGAVGEDDLGSGALADLADEGIDVTAALVLPGVATGVALIIVDDAGENAIAVASGANGRLDGPLVEQALLGSGGATSADVLLTNLEISDEAVLAAALFARQRGMRLLVNPAPARALPAALLELGPLLLPNEGEAMALSGAASAAEAARLLAAQTGQPVVVTLGQRGALVLEGDRVTQVAAAPVDVVDTTGAGDTFAGAVAAEIAAGRTLAEAARFAVAAASVSVTVAGARRGMPRRAEVMAHLG